jgi:Ca2+-binding RTX toxin-like protein
MPPIIGHDYGETINIADGVTPGNDVIYALGGDDIIFALGGNDTIYGGAGADAIDGGDGWDTVGYTDSGVGVWVDLDAGQGFFGTAAGDFILNVENVTGSYYNDVLAGDVGANLLSGLDGNDWLAGGGGNDSLYGGNGNDLLRGGAGADYLNGGAGIDTATYSDSAAGVFVSLQIDATAWGDSIGDELDSIENVTGSEFSDTLIGDGAANVLSGLGGNDTLTGLGGNDFLFGGNGNDTLRGGTGADMLTGGAGLDSFTFDTAAESGLDAATVDEIMDFSAADGDKIVLSLIDANTELANDQAFTFIGAADYTGAGQIRVVDDGVDTYLAFSTDSDPDNEFAIRLDGLVMPTEDWFIL